jgi:general secretion pathway protein G
MRKGCLVQSLSIIVAGILALVTLRWSLSSQLTAAEVGKERIAAQDLSHLQVSPMPDGLLVFDERTGEVLKLSPAAKDVQRLGVLRQDEGGKLQFLPGPGAGGGADAAKILLAQTDIASLQVALSAFEIDNKRFPSTEEGLLALIVQPGGADNWKGPYIKGAVPKDPWGNPYVYEQPGKRNPKRYDLQSLGPDRREGGGDDLTN